MLVLSVKNCELKRPHVEEENVQVTSVLRMHSLRACADPGASCSFMIFASWFSHNWESHRILSFVRETASPPARAVFRSLLLCGCAFSSWDFMASPSDLAVSSAFPVLWLRVCCPLVTLGSIEDLFLFTRGPSSSLSACFPRAEVIDCMFIYVGNRWGKRHLLRMCFLLPFTQNWLLFKIDVPRCFTDSVVTRYPERRYLLVKLLNAKYHNSTKWTCNEGSWHHGDDGAARGWAWAPSSGSQSAPPKLCHFRQRDSLALRFCSHFRTSKAVHRTLKLCVFWNYFKNIFIRI